MTKDQEKIIRDWFETIKKNLPAGAEISSIREHRDGKTTIVFPAGAEISSIREHRDGKTTIVYEYGKHENTYRDGKRHGQIEVTKDHITQINRENKLRELGL